MPIPEELKQKILAELENAIDQVGDCPMTEGSLLPILNHAAQKISRLTTEGLTEIAADKAAFSPSGLPALRLPKDELSGGETPRVNDGTGKHSH